MAFAQFVSPEYITTYNIIPDNVDKQVINKYIRLAQEINIKEVLGYSLYMKIMNDYLTTGTTTGVYLQLMTECVKQALSEWTMWQAAPFLRTRITNIGIVQNESDHSKASSDKAYENYRENIRSAAEHFTEEIRKFLLNNASALPELYLVTGIDRPGPRVNNYSTGIYLGKNDIKIKGVPVVYDYKNNPDDYPYNPNT